MAEHGEVAVVADLAELLSLCAQLRAQAAPGRPVSDGVVWAATVSLLGGVDIRLTRAREALRDEGAAAPLESLAADVAGGEPLRIALGLHAARTA
jgi:hypothetical protein